MEANEKLRQWMDANGITSSALAARMKYSYDVVWLYTADRKPITDSFRGRFAETFGYDTAKAVFAGGDELEPEAADAAA